jgi:hypothetical protein
MDLLQLVRGCTFDDFLFSPNVVSCHGGTQMQWISQPGSQNTW